MFSYVGMSSTGACLPFQLFSLTVTLFLMHTFPKTSSGVSRRPCLVFIADSFTQILTAFISISGEFWLHLAAYVFCLEGMLCMP